jgi:CRISPR system Cascade subunit CasD
MGLPRGDTRIVALNDAIRIAVRTDRSGMLMTDYHTVTGQIRTADGGKRGAKGENSTILSYRQYLQDASFLVAVSADEDTIEAIHEAMLAPVWAVYLGRKSCVPSQPVFLEVLDRYTSLEAAISEYPVNQRSDKSVGYEIDDETGYPRRDIVTGAPGRIFGQRRVRLKPLIKE